MPRHHYMGVGVSADTDCVKMRLCPSNAFAWHQADTMLELVQALPNSALQVVKKTHGQPM